MTAVSEPAGKTGKLLWVLFLAAVLAFFIPLAGGLKIRKQLEKRLDLSITGRFVPDLFTPSFNLRQAGFEWKGKVRLESGDLKVQYDPAAFLLRNALRLRLSGRGLRVRLLDDWARSQGVENVQLERFEASLEFGRQGLQDIEYVHAESPALQFHIQKTETIKEPSAQNPETKV